MQTSKARITCSISVSDPRCGGLGQALHLHEQLPFCWTIYQSHPVPLSGVVVDVDLEPKPWAPVVDPHHIQGDLSPGGVWWIPHGRPVDHLHQVYPSYRTQVETQMIMTSYGLLHACMYARRQRLVVLTTNTAPFHYNEYNTGSSYSTIGMPYDSFVCGIHSCLHTHS